MFWFSVEKVNFLKAIPGGFLFFFKSIKTGFGLYFYWKTKCDLNLIRFGNATDCEILVFLKWYFSYPAFSAAAMDM